jgi:hypothetical protein
MNKIYFDLLTNELLYEYRDVHHGKNSITTWSNHINNVLYHIKKGKNIASSITLAQKKFPIK